MGATRNLLCYAINRTAGYLVTLNFSGKTFNTKGFFDKTYAPVNKMAGVVDLSDDDIQRLRDGGITINFGIMVTIPEELANIPDSITYGDDRYKVEKSVISEHVSILYCSRWPLGSAVEEYGA